MSSMPPHCRADACAVAPAPVAADAAETSGGGGAVAAAAAAAETSGGGGAIPAAAAAAPRPISLLHSTLTYPFPQHPS